MVPKIWAVGCVTENWTIREDRGRFHSYAVDWKLSLELFQLPFSGSKYSRPIFPSLLSLFPQTSQACLFHQKCFRLVIRHCCSFGCEVSSQWERERKRERADLWGCSPLRRPSASTRPWRSTPPQRRPTPMLPRWVSTSCLVFSFVAWCFTFQFWKGSVALESCYHIQSHFGGEIAR